MKWLSRSWFKLAGWSYAGGPPRSAKCVIIGAPHTSNWDFLLFLAATSHFGIDAKVIGKHTLVEGPFGGIMRRLGVIPVDRSRDQGLVEQLVAAFDAASELALVIAPEGTRGFEPYWKSGFYRIALAAGVPLVVATVDRPSKTVTMHEEFMLTGDVTADMDQVRALVDGSRGINPAGASAVRLRDEDAL